MSSLLRSNLVVATGTAVSRVSGLARWFVFAYVIGQTALADSYVLANETPNIVYDLLLGGVLSATLVPLFTSFAAIDDGDEADDHATNVVITVAVTLMVALTVVAVIAAPLIFRVYSLDLSDDVDPELFRDVGTTLARVFLIQILFYGLTGIANAYLNSRRRFVAAAWSPVLPNLIIIVTLLTLPGAGSTEYGLQDVLDEQPGPVDARSRGDGRHRRDGDHRSCRRCSPPASGSARHGIGSTRRSASCWFSRVGRSGSSSPTSSPSSSSATSPRPRAKAS